MVKLLKIQVISSLLLAIFKGITLGQVPQLINYQGVLVDPGTGLPVPDDTYSIVFSIYDVSSGSSAIWAETHNVQTKDGMYNVQLGSITALTPTILSGPEKYLGIKVGADPEMTPRKRIVSVAYAIMSEEADKLDGKHASAFADSIHSHDDHYYTETELNTSDGDPPNQGSNRVSWDNLTNVPEGFADGIDNTGGGGTISGSGTANYLPLFTSSTSIGNSIFYQTGGNIGIGTTTPTSILDIVGGDAKINALTIGRGSGNVSSNSAFGYLALYSNTTGYGNTANGFQSLYSNTEGHYNTANGYCALMFNTTGMYNTAIGYQALLFNTTENTNTAVGRDAGNNACSNGTFLGAYAYSYADGYSNVTGLGYQARPTASNVVYIGNTSVTRISGQVTWTAFSDGRYKLAVTENVKGLDFIMKLRPVTYQLDVNRLGADLKEGQRRDEKGNITTESSAIDIKARNEKSQIVYTGFVAQEVEQAARDIGYDFSGVDAPKNENDFYGLRYAEFVVPLVKAVQEKQKIIEDMRNEIAALKKKLGE